MPARTLPPRPNLDQLKLQAKELHDDHAAGRASAAARIATHHPRFVGQRESTVAAAELALADAQLVIAREYGFDSWPQLKQRVELGPRIDAIPRHPRFAEALAALDAGDADQLRRLLASDPSLVHARTNLDPPYGYFTGAMLLHHVAGNPGRSARLPPNIVEIARVLLDAGADVNALTIGPSPSNSPETQGASTMGLVLTSKQASDMNVSGPLIDLLLERGATVDVHAEGALDGSLANHAPRAAEKLIALGAKPDLFAAAALGRVDLLRTFFDASGALSERPRRHGKELAEADAIGLAMLYAYVRQQPDAVDYLLARHGNWNMIGVNNGTALHRAAWAGDLAMVKRLVEKGADINNRDNPFFGTPMGWANHNDQGEVVRWIQQHCDVDLHDAVAFDLRDQVAARIAERPASVNGRINDGEIPMGTPLHTAARLNRQEAAAILLEHGADINAVAGDGSTPLDTADAHAAAGVALMLERRGAVRNLASDPHAHPRLRPFQRLADDIVEACKTDSVEALARIGAFFKRGVSFFEVRRFVRVQLEKEEAADISAPEAREVVARSRGFRSWAELAASVLRSGSKGTWAVPIYQVDDRDAKLAVRRPVEANHWDEILTAMEERKLTALDAGGQMTDAVIERLVELTHVTRLELGGSRELTDAGVRLLARLPHLQHLDLSGTGVTDRGLGVLRELSDLRSFRLHHDHVTDAGGEHLGGCERLERVEMFPGAGVRTLRALAGKRTLRHVRVGRAFAEAALSMFRDYPAFRTWQGGAITYALMEADAGPTYLSAYAADPYSTHGLAGLAGLDGLFALNLDNPAAKEADLAPLLDLANLGWLGHDATDRSMRQIGALPHLRMLMAQDTEAGDEGFVALSRSRTLAYIWGRRCYNLRSRGFTALSTMPSLRGLSVSCRNVDDDALATLPRFPALRELMPMDVQDDGFRHVGRCVELEALWCMYCRDTTDAATEQLTALQKLKTYYAGQTRITDRSLQVLSGLRALEHVTFWNCSGITDAGVARLAALPALQDITIESC
ncbi:MAG TPA: ankyrin repeat domain-containing protein, partial [Vicinamibacterales bacterium]|nr:ankyrin repeat domain-containing protein [Vicinamibacterales bacterium]